MPVTVDAAHREVAGLYNEHHRWLSAWLRNRLGDAHQAADIAHDIFCACWRVRSRCRRASRAPF